MSSLAGCRVLITGSNGFLGRHALAHGERLGAEMHAFGRRDPGVAGVVFHGGDFDDAASVRRAVATAAPDAIMHLAAGGVSYGAGALEELIRTNALGLHALLDGAAQLSITPAVVCAGSGFEYGAADRARRESDPPAPGSSYGVSKAAATAIAACHAQRMPITLLRPFSIYGAGEPPARLAAYVIERTLAGQPVDLTAGEQLRDYAEAGDVAEAFWRALASPPDRGALRVLNVASGRVITLRAFVELLAAKLEISGLRADLRFGARPYRSDEMMNYTADISLLERTLGWRPPTPLEDGLARCVRAALANR